MGLSLLQGLSEANDEDSTHALDGVTHDLEDNAGTTDCYYIFSVGGNGVPVSVTWHGYVNLNGDTWGAYAYNWGATAWEQVGTIDGANGSTITTETFDLTNAQVGTGANLGEVRLRFYSTDGTKIATDRITCAYAVVAQSVGYAGGAIWVDTNASNANTESYVDGVADNPVSTWAAALTLNTALGLDRFRIKAGSAITLTGNSDNYEIVGQAYSVALGGQSIDGAFFFGATVSGIGTTSGNAPVFEDCPIGNVTLPPSIFRRCFLFGTITNSGIGDWFINHCMSRIAGGSAIFDFGDAIGNTNLNMRLWSGDIQIESMGDTGTDTAEIEGFGQIQKVLVRVGRFLLVEILLLRELQTSP